MCMWLASYFSIIILLCQVQTKTLFYVLVCLQMTYLMMVVMRSKFWMMSLHGVLLRKRIVIELGILVRLNLTVCRKKKTLQVILQNVQSLLCGLFLTLMNTSQPGLGSQHLGANYGINIYNNKDYFLIILRDIYYNIS